MKKYAFITLVLFQAMAFGLALYPSPSEAMTVTLAWDANSETDLAGYKLYYGGASGGPYNGTGSDKGNSPVVIPLSALMNVSLPEFPVVLPDGTYYFVLTAYDTGGLESGYSNQVTATGPIVQYALVASVIGGNGTVSPVSGTYNAGSIVTLTATPNAGYRVLAWTGTANDALKTNTNTVVMSAARTVTVTFEPIPVAPTIATQPAGVTVNLGATATFSIVANGTPPLNYQWQSRPGATGTWTTIATGTSSTITTAATIASDNGRQYRCIVTNSAGTVTSATATLTLNLPPAQPTNVRVLTQT